MKLNRRVAPSDWVMIIIICDIKLRRYYVYKHYTLHFSLCCQPFKSETKSFLLEINIKDFYVVVLLNYFTAVCILHSIAHTRMTLVPISHHFKDIYVKKIILKYILFFLFKCDLGLLANHNIKLYLTVTLLCWLLRPTTSVFGCRLSKNSIHFEVKSIHNPPSQLSLRPFVFSSGPKSIFFLLFWGTLKQQTRLFLVLRSCRIS